MLEMNQRARTQGLGIWLLGFWLLAIATTAGCGSSQRAPGDTSPAEPMPVEPDADVVSVQRGQATFYAARFHGRTTASGERFDMHAMTAAHRRLPFGTRVRVTNLNNERSVVVRINDRGPFGNRRRIIDVSRAAAEELRMVRSGVVPVKVEVLAD
jgi:rare lipoprotein A